VPVGADWTDNRHVLGFVNHLRDDGTDAKRPIYQTTPILDLLLEASEHKDVPYVLILDEMNLSHVERYFADFLSVMERSGGSIHLHNEGTGNNAESRMLRYADDKLGVPQAMDYPQNLFVIGTVNIDETTYMFSPKVLDRANVIEFKVGAEAIENYLQNPTGYPEMKRADDGVAANFLQLSLNARTNALPDLEKGLKTTLNLHLLEIFGIMERGRYEFAYRTLNEVIRYLRVCHEIAEDKKIWIDTAWKADLDAQILQKILPKLHGSIGRISDLIVNLADYCHRGSLPSENAVGVTKLKDVAGLDASTAVFPQSFKKLQTMAATLQTEQFVSFIR
jgi:5-methylcytosine-specific restriction endonuclease McrBC GTP-binding regulatory subunit McrB